MKSIRPLEEVQARLTEYTDTLRYYLHITGYDKKDTFKVSAKKAEKIRKKYSLENTISDFVFGILDGWFAGLLLVATYYDDYESGEGYTLDDLVLKIHTGIRYFINRCIYNNPSLIKSKAIYSCEDECIDILHDAHIYGDDLVQQLNDCHYTPFLFGHICGYKASFKWVMYEVWGLGEQDFDEPVNWESFFDYLEEEAFDLRIQNIYEVGIGARILADSPIGL